MRLAVVVLLAGCGRLGFSAEPDGAGVNATPGVVFAMTCEATSGGILPDVSGHGADAHCAGPCPALVAGKHGLGCSFTGVERLDVTLDMPAAFSIALWMNLQMPGDTSCPINRALDGTNTNGNSWQLCTQGNGRWFWGVQGSGSPTVPYTYSSWHQVVAQYDGTRALLYLDGASVFTSPPTPITYDASPVTIGADIDFGANKAAITGVVDDVTIYDHVLSGAEIAALAGS